MNTNSKLISSLTTSTMMVIGSVSILYILQQLLPRQVQPESYGIWYLGPAGHIMNVQNGPDERPLYVGEAIPSTLDDEVGWRIYKYGYVIDPVSGDIISGTVRYAGGSTAFDKVWGDRAEYEYS